MAVSIQITAILKPAGAPWRVRFNDGLEREYTSAAQIQEAADRIDNDVELVKDIFMGLFHQKSPSLNFSFVQGKTFTFDLDAQNPIVFG